jgi:ABC-type sugar transport system permease subunit
MAYSSTPKSILNDPLPLRHRKPLTNDARRTFPDLEPAGAMAEADTGHLARIRGELVAQFREIRADPGVNNALSRLTVYALTAALLVLAFPVGFAMLMFNLLAGENLRVTIQVVALTGLAVAVSQTETAARVLGLG